MSRVRLSVCLITRDEADNIDDCLASVRWADEIIVLDGGSTDDTVERARRRGARVETAPDWRGFGIQRQRAQALATGDWILMLDADERVTPALAAEIRAAVEHDDRHAAYTLPRLSWCFGRYIHHGGWYPDHVLRLYPRRRGRYSDALVHERVILDAGLRVKRLRGDLLHYTYRDLRHYLVKSAHYAAAWAEQRELQGRRASLFQGSWHALACLLRMYLFRLGFMDGRAGLLLALLSAHSTFAKYADLWVRSQPRRPDLSANRILELCLSDGHGGLELYVARLCRLLHERGRDCRAVVARNTLLAERLEEQPFPVHQLRVRFRPFPLIAALRLARYLQHERIDTVHIHASRDLPLAVMAKQMTRRQVRLVYSRHMRLTRPKRGFLHRLLYRSVDCYIALSQVMAEEATRYLPLRPEALQMVYPGAPAPRRASTPTESSPEKSGDTLKVGLFSRIERPKGQHVLIEALGRLRERGVLVEATIIGHAMDEEYAAFLRAETHRLGLESLVSFSGFMPSAQDLMGHFDVIALPSHHETFGLVLVEAMRAGVAVVGTDAGGVPEIIDDGESGLLFPPGSAEALADRLQYLAERPEERRRLAAAGREKADRLFSEEAHIERLEPLLLPGLGAMEPASRQAPSLERAFGS